MGLLPKAGADVFAEWLSSCNKADEDADEDAEDDEIIDNSFTDKSILRSGAPRSSTRCVQMQRSFFYYYRHCSSDT